MGDGEGLHPALSRGLGISGHIKKPQSVLTECLSDTTGGAYGPPRYFKGAEIQTYYPLSTSKVCSSFSFARTPLIDLCQFFGTGIDHPLSNDPHFSLEKSTVAFFKELHDLDDSSIKYRDGNSSQFGHHADVQQVHVCV